MSKHGRYFLSIIVLFFGNIISLYCADTLNVVKSKVYFDNLSVENIWLKSSNPAGLALFNNLIQIKCVETGYTYKSNDLKFPAEPGIINSFYAKTQGYTKVGNLTFFGSFGYINEHYNELLYNNTLVFDPDIPYILGDTIGGKQFKEGFILKGSVAYPITKKLAIGINADYENYVGAKMKDPRNKNDISTLVVAPGIIFDAGKLTIGISGGPVIFNNDISISVMENAKYSLFQFMGMGYYKSIKNIYSYSNAYYGKGFTIEGQAKYLKKKFTDFLIVNFKSYSEEVRYDNSRRLIDGISDKINLSLKNYINVRSNDILHQISVSLDMMQLNGTEVMQHFKSIVVGSYKYDTLITDSWTKGKQINSNYNGTLGYYVTGYDGSFEKYKIDFGFSAQYQTIYHYPVQNYGFQEILNILPSAGYKKYFRIRTFTFIPEIRFEYRKNIFKDMDYFITDQCIPEFQNQEYIARNSDIIRGMAGVSIMKKSGNKYFSEYFLILDTSYGYTPDNGNGTFNNLFLNCSIGLIF